MKGIIVIPKYLESLWTPKSGPDGLLFNDIMSENVHLYYAIKETFGFDITYADEINILDDYNVVCIFGVPYHNRPKLIPGLLELDKSIKLINFPGDLQCYDSQECLENKRKVFERSDLILSFSREYFSKQYPEFLDKHVLLSKSFAPHDRYASLDFNKTPKQKCLLSGSINKEVYPIRSHILENLTPQIHYQKAGLGGKPYANLIHSHFCAVTCSSIYGYALAKNFEIAATGSLLLSEQCSDLDESGFVPYEHYIPITKDDVLKQINKCLSNHKDYTEIRMNGMQFVRKKHSILNRVEQLRQIFNSIKTGEL